MKPEKFQFEKGSRVVVAGPSSCGKTEFVKKVIDFRKSVFSEPPPDHVVYVYKFAQKFFESYDFVEFTTEIPQTLDPEQHTLLIIDDVALDKEALQEASSLFCRGRHLGLSILFITQNLFLPSPHYRTLSLNASQFILFKNVRAVHQVESLGRQIFGSKQKLFLDAYKDATQEAYSYLLIDLQPMQKYRLRTRIFPNENEVVYLP